MMKDDSGKIIYVGKAKDLKKRVSSYFLPNRDVKTTLLVRHIEDIEYIITSNEYEALILENNLIKKWNPKYNISLKDDKTFPVIRVTHEKYPRVFRTRRVVPDGSVYYGPYADVAKLDQVLELADRLYPLRKCKGHLRMRTSPCLYYHIGRCKAPCTGLISQEEYGQLVSELKDLLSGKNDEVKKRLKTKMRKASENLEFERAAELRDMIQAIESVQTQQKVQDFVSRRRDYIAFYAADEVCTISVHQMEEGKLLGRHLIRTKTVTEQKDLLEEFVLQFYDTQDVLPQEIYLSVEVDLELVSRFLNSKATHAIKVHTPIQGRHRHIIRMAEENAKSDVLRRMRTVRQTEGLVILKKELGLPELPRRIEGFDIAQLSGKYPVASLISFYDGVPDRKNYRRFHLRTLRGQIDDYEAIREAVARRYTRVINESLPQPDLILIDGGKGQVAAAREIIETLGLYHIPVVGLAKEFEHIFLYDRKDPVILPVGNAGLKILQAVRDETHRFATGLNKKMRQKDSRFSLLESIPGIGPVRSKTILKEFSSIDQLRKAEPELIARRCSIPLNTAIELKKSL